MFLLSVHSLGVLQVEGLYKNRSDDGKSHFDLVTGRGRSDLCATQGALIRRIWPFPNGTAPFVQGSIFSE